MFFARPSDHAGDEEAASRRSASAKRELRQHEHAAVFDRARDARRAARRARATGRQLAEVERDDCATCEPERATLSAAASDAPIRNSSTARAHCRPSRIAQTTSDWPRRMSPAAKTLGTDVR